MMNSPFKRWSLITILGLIVFFLAYFMPEENNPTSSSVTSNSAVVNDEAHELKDKVSDEFFMFRKRTLSRQDGADLFESKSWFVPPPPPPLPPPPPPPPPPSPPPFPYVGMGSFMSAETNGPVIFLVRNDILFTVKPGDVLESTYRIDSFISGQLVVTFLPLKMQQIINFNVQK